MFLVAGVAGAPLCGAQSGDLGVQVRLSKPSAMLGEPVWVEVTVTNLSKEKLLVPLSSGYLNNAVSISVPEAVREKSAMERCSYAGSFSGLHQAPDSIEPGATVTRRYPVKGNFRIARPGAYTVVVHTLLSSHNREKVFTDRTDKFSLQVTSADLSTLLAQEQSLAAHAMEIYQSKFLAQFAPNAPKQSAKERRADYEQLVDMDAIFDALAQYPTAGMEPVFEAWPFATAGKGDGILALEHLNTPEARAALARLVAFRSQIVRTIDIVTSLKAATALVRLGDRTFLPTLERLAAYADFGFSAQALQTLGKFGGEQELEFLHRLARSSQDESIRAGAISAMADTGSAKAVPMLIDLFPTPDMDGNIGLALIELTHYQPGKVQDRAAVWRAWWAANEKTAHIYASDECMELQGVWRDGFPD